MGEGGELLSRSGASRFVWALWTVMLGCGQPNGGLDAVSEAPGTSAEALAAESVARIEPPEQPSGALVRPRSSPLEGWLAGCPESMPDWVPADTGGPDGEPVLACLERLGSATDARIPMDQVYELTTFGGPGDEQPTNCEQAPDADGTWFYAANRQRFGCGARFRLVDEARSRCVVVEVADLGPNICVEEAGGRPAWDVSPLVSKHLFDARQAGWSEHRRVWAAPVDSATPLGPCDDQLSPARDRVPIGSGAIGASCSADSACSGETGACMRSEHGWPGGYCSTACRSTASCATRVGAHPVAFCAALPQGAQCLARCDFTLFDGGCRPGYACRFAPGLGGEEASPVCVPRPATCGTTN